MIPRAKEATFPERYNDLNGKGEKEIRIRIFNEDESERAEAIAKALDGMTIESARHFLMKIDSWLLQSEIHLSD